MSILAQAADTLSVVESGDGTRTIDAIVVALYLIVSFGVGIFASRLLGRGSKTDDATKSVADKTTDNEEAYYLAGRRIPGWMNGISYAVTAMNADVAPAYCGMAVVVGLPIAWFYLPRFALGWMIAAMLFAVRWRQLGVRTGPEFYALRFNRASSRFVRVYSAIFAVAVNMAPWIGAGMLGVHQIFGPVFGIEDKVTTLSLILPVLVLYVWTSGFAGVLITDVLQSLIIVGANVLLLIMVFNDFGGPAGLSEALQAAHPENQADILSATPVWGHRILAPIVVLAWFIVPTVGKGGSVDLEGQRLFSCRNDREAAKMGVWAEIALFAMLLLLTLPALGALANHPELYLADSAGREKAYGLLLEDYLPVGLLGIALAALLASVMSTIDSHLNYGAQTLVNDVLRQIWPNAKWLDPSDKRTLWIGRLSMLVILAGGIAVTYNATSLISIAIVLGGMFGSTAAFYWGQWWWWRVNFWSWLTAIGGGPIVYFTLGYGLSLWPWWAEQVAASPAQSEVMSMLQAVIAMLLTTTLWIAATLATKPESMETLTAFYKQARPMGLWGPVRHAVQADPEFDNSQLPPTGLLVGGLGVSVLGAAWISAGVLGLSQLAVGQWLPGTGLLITAILGGLIFRQAFAWHMQRMDALGDSATN